MNSKNQSLLAALLPFTHVILSILGLVFLVAAAYVFAPVAGLLATGVALLVLGYYFESELKT